MSTALNPYKTAGRLVIDRLKWDLKPVSWSSRAHLQQMAGKKNGRSAVILCNGPSLLKSDLSLLGGVDTFGLNKINLLFDKSAFRPTYIVAVNPLVNEQNAEFFNQTDIPLFLRCDASDYIRHRSNVTFLHTYNAHRFAEDCSISLYEGYTVTFVALQLAFHMGYDKVALIGCDHNFAQSGPPNKLVTSGETDHSHFDPNYFAGGVKWHLPDLQQSEVSYILARQTYENSGRKIYNAGIGGKLEVFERIPLEDFVKL